MHDLNSIIKQVCDRLIIEGRLTRKDLDYVKRIQSSEGGLLDEILVGTGILSEELIQRSFASHFGCRYWERSALRKAVSELSNPQNPFSESFVQQHFFVALGKSPITKNFRIVLSRPPSEAFLEHLKKHTYSSKVEFDFASRSALAEASIQLNQSQSPKADDAKLLLSQSPPRYKPDEHFPCPSCGTDCTGDMLLCENCGTAFIDSLKEENLKPGQTVGPFQIERPLARGGMAEIYMVTDLRTSKVAALKILQSRLLTEKQAIKRFQREARALRRLEHPGIVKLLEYGFQESVGLYIATEFLNGKEYLELLQESAPLTLEELISFIVQICDALDYAHQHEVIHRDLKPDNIILVTEPDGSQSAKLIDFGLAKVFDEQQILTQVGLALGTPRYMSPEQVSTQPLDHRTDIYSFAVILFESLTAKPLFQAKGNYQMMMRHLYAPPPTLAEARPDLHFPPGLSFLLEKALAKDPKQRPTTLQEFKDQLLSLAHQNAVPHSELNHTLETSSSKHQVSSEPKIPVFVSKETTKSQTLPKENLEKMRQTMAIPTLEPVMMEKLLALSPGEQGQLTALLSTESNTSEPNTPNQPFDGAVAANSVSLHASTFVSENPCTAEKKDPSNIEPSSFSPTEKQGFAFQKTGVLKIDPNDATKLDPSPFHTATESQGKFKQTQRTDLGLATTWSSLDAPQANPRAQYRSEELELPLEDSAQDLAVTQKQRAFSPDTGDFDFFLDPQIETTPPAQKIIPSLSEQSNEFLKFSSQPLLSIESNEFLSPSPNPIHLKEEARLEEDEQPNFQQKNTISTPPVDKEIIDQMTQALLSLKLEEPSQNVNSFKGSKTQKISSQNLAKWSDIEEPEVESSQVKYKIEKPKNIVIKQATKKAKAKLPKPMAKRSFSKAQSSNIHTMPSAPSQPRRQQNPKSQKKSKSAASSISELFTYLFRAAVYLALMGLAGYAFWFLFIDEDMPEFPKTKAPIIKSLNKAQNVFRLTKPKRKKPKGPGYWKKAYRLGWVWSEKKQGWIKKHKWMKIWIPKKKNKKRRKKK